jgi:hypothetical protein
MSVVGDLLPLALPIGSYENWQVVSTSRTDDLLKVMVANPTMIDDYLAGIPGNAKPFPNGSKIAKIEWKFKKSTEAPISVDVPDVQLDVFFIEKENMRFPGDQRMGMRYVLWRRARHVHAQQRR